MKASTAADECERLQLPQPVGRRGRVQAHQGAARHPSHLPQAAIHGHVFISFLALVLRKELIDRLAARRSKTLEWQRILDPT
jgi:hypothetical protein